MAPLISSQLHEHDGGLGFLFGEGLSWFVCVSVCRMKKKKKMNSGRERERKREDREDRVRE